MLQRAQRRQLNRNRTSHKPVYGSKDSATSLKAGKRFIELFIFNLDAETTEVEVTSFLRDNNISVIEIDCQSKAESSNKSFRIKVNSDLLETLLKPEFWPAQVGVRPFFRKRVNYRENSQNNAF